MPPTITGGEKELATLFHALLWQARSPAVSETILFLSRYLEDASYFKFKTITLGYSLPHSLLSKIHVTGARIFVSLDNFFTLTKYSGYDPEFSYESNPTGNSYGADFGEQATLKSFIIGASINF